jgi:hypothetical protein
MQAPANLHLMTNSLYMFTHPEYERLSELWRPTTRREEELSKAFEDLFVAGAENAGANDYALAYSVSFADRMKLMDTFSDIPPFRFIDVWNYEASFWRFI